MTLGTPTKKYIDSDGMQHSDWTLSGAPTFSIDQHFPTDNVAFNGDSVNNKGQQSPIIVSTDGSKHTISMWYRHITDFQSQMLYAQGNLAVAGDRIFISLTSAGEVKAQFLVSAANQLNTTSANLSLDDGAWHHLLVTVDGSADSCDIYIDGVEVTYSAHNQKFGTGYTGVESGVDDTTVGADIASGANTLMQTGTAVTRMKVWATEFADLTAAEEEFASECESVSVSGEVFFAPDCSDTDKFANQVGGIIFVADQHNTGPVAPQPDMVDDALHTTIGKMVTSGLEATYAWWINLNSNTNFARHWRQLDVGGGFSVREDNAGALICQCEGNGTNSVVSTEFIDNFLGEWKHCIFTHNGTHARFYLDGVLDKANAGAGAFLGYNAGNNTAFATRANGFNQIDGIASRPYAFDYMFSDCQALKLFNREVALIIPDKIIGVEGRPDFRAGGILHEDIWNKGQQRFSRR